MKQEKPAFVLISREEDSSLWRAEFERIVPGADFRVWPEIGDARQIVMAALDRRAITREVFEALPHLSCVVYLGHGVNELLACPHVRKDITITRLKDPGIIRSMTQYAVLHVLYNYRMFAKYREQQVNRLWRRHTPSSTSGVHVGVMGLGSIGQSIAKAMLDLGFRVSGWSRSRHCIDKIECYHGKKELGEFLRHLDYLVCVLPLTANTRNIVDASVIAAIKPGCYFINIGRGELVVEDALLAALDSGHLLGASLDVICNEPLKVESPLWCHPTVIVTPHEAGARPEGSITEVATNFVRLIEGKTLANTVDISHGY